MTSPGPAFQECTCHENVPAPICDDRWSDFIGQDRDSCHLGTLSTILLHFTQKMIPGDHLLLADVTLHCARVCPAGKVDILNT